MGSRLFNPDGTPMTYKQSQAAEMAYWKAAWRFKRLARDEGALKKMMVDEEEEDDERTIEAA